MDILIMLFKGLHNAVYLKSGFDKNIKHSAVIVGDVLCHPEPPSGMKGISLQLLGVLSTSSSQLSTIYLHNCLS